MYDTSHTHTLRKLVFAFVFALLILGLRSSSVSAATRTWDGGGGADTNWSTCANWDGPDICPIAGDTVTFNSTSTNNSTIDAGFGGSIGVINVNSGYTGTITQAETLAITSTFTVSAGTYNASNQTLTVTSTTTVSGGTLNLNSSSTTLATLTFSSGSLTMSSGTTNISGNLTFSGGGTFSANGGTINFNGSSSATLSCNSVTFNLIALSGSGGGIKTIQSNCSFPLGNNPTVLGNVTLNGALSGTGTLALAVTTGTTFTMNNGSSISGFSSLTNNEIFTINGGTITNIISITANATVNVSGATLDLSNFTSVDTHSQFNFSSGTLTMPSSGVVTMAGINITGGTFNANGGNITFNGSGTINCNNVTFNTIAISNPSGTLTIGSTCTLPIGTNSTISNGGNITLIGTISGNGTLTVGGTTFTLNAGATLSGFSGLIAQGLTISGATANFSSYSPFSLSRNLTLSSGAFTSPPTVTLTGGNQTISGAFTFNNITKNVTSAATFTLPSGTTTTVLGTLNLSGNGATKLSLRSSSSGAQWKIDAQGGRVLNSLDVQDSNNINSNPMIADANSVNSGNNTNWSFGSSNISFYLDYPGGNSHITNTNPTYRWKKATVTNNSAISKYELYIQPKDLITNASIGTRLYIDNILPNIGDNKKYAYYSSYTLYDDGDFLNLLPSNYKLTPGKYNFRVVAHDSAGNIREESLDFFVDGTTFTPTSKPVGNYVAQSGTPINQSQPVAETPTPEPTFLPVVIPETVKEVIQSNFPWWILILIPIILLILFLWKRRKNKGE